VLSALYTELNAPIIQINNSPTLIARTRTYIIAWNLSFGFLQLGLTDHVFRYIYTLMLTMTIPIMFGGFIFLCIAFFYDKRVQGFIDRGMPIT